jgi:hypothetical protein
MAQRRRLICASRSFESVPKALPSELHCYTNLQCRDSRRRQTKGLRDYGVLHALLNHSALNNP